MISFYLSEPQDSPQDLILVQLEMQMIFREYFEITFQSVSTYALKKMLFSRVLTRILKIGVKMLSAGKSWSFTILFYCDF